jgi:hypothetical protein
VLVWIGYFGLVGSLFLRPHRVARKARSEPAGATAS